MHYDEQRGNDITNISNDSANKIKVTLPYSSTINQDLTITWHIDEMVKTVCVDLIKKSKEST